MKTFQQFCEDVYQLNEGATTAAAINPIQRGLSAIARPLVGALFQLILLMMCIVILIKLANAVLVL